MAVRNHMSEIVDAIVNAELISEIERLLRAYVELAEVKDAEDELRPIGVENRFVVSIYRGVEGEVACAGVIDMYADTKYGPCIVDHKTASSCGASYFVGHEHAIQAVIYMRAAQQLGIRAGYFAWNVLAKTKTPYLKRLYSVVSDVVSNRFQRDLALFGRYLLTMPEEPAKIVEEVPGMPGACRRCIFSALCDYPQHIDEIVEAEFTTREYDDNLDTSVED